MSNAYITLENESGTLKKKFKVLQSGYKPIEEKPTTMRQTVTGKMDNQTAQIVHRWEHTLKAYETDPDDPNGTDSDVEGYGTLEHLRTFFEYNRPGGYPSNDVKLTDNNGDVWMVRIVNEMSENPLSVHIAGVNAEFHIPLVMVEAYPRHDLKATFSTDDISLQDDQVLNRGYEGIDEGKLTVVKDDGGLRIISSKLDFLPQISAAWGDLGVYGEEFSPTFGKVLLGTLNMGAARKVALGFNEGGDVDLSAGNRRYVFFSDDGSLKVFHESASANIEVCGLWTPETDLPVALVLGGFDANGVPWVPGKRRSDFIRGGWCLVERPTFYTVDRDDVLAYFPFNGSSPYEDNFDVLTRDYLGREASAETGSVVGMGGKFLKGVNTVIGFTNLEPNPSFETNTTGWGASGTNTIARSAEQAKFGSYSAKCTYQDNGGLAYDSITLTAEAHSLSAWVYIPSDYDGTQVQLIFSGFAGGAGTSSANADMTKTDQWQLVQVQDYTPDAGDLAGLLFLWETGTPTAGKYVFLDGVQCTATPYCLPYRDGSMPGAAWSGTANGSTTVVTASVLKYALSDLGLDFTSGSEGTIGLWVKREDWDAQGASADAHALRAYVDTNNFIYLAWVSGSSILQGAWKGTGNQDASGGLSGHTDGEHSLFVMTWDFSGGDTDVVFYWDDATPVSHATSDPFASNPTYLFVGSDHVGAKQWNGDIDELFIFNRAITSDEVSAIYGYGSALLNNTAERQLIYALPGGSTDPLYPVFSSYDGDGTLDDMILSQIPLLVQRAILFSDTFTDPDSIDLEDHIPDYSASASYTIQSGVWAIASSKLQADLDGVVTFDPGSTCLEPFYHVAVTTPGSGTDAAWLILRYSDEDNYLGVKITPGTGGNDLDLVEVEDGAETALESADIDWSASTEYDILVIVEGCSIRVLVDEVEKLHGTSDFNDDQTTLGFADDGTSNFSFDNVYVLPRTSTVYADEMEKEGY